MIGSLMLDVICGKQEDVFVTVCGVYWADGTGGGGKC